MQKKEPYIGSVRFFKNLILLAVIILIAIPVGVAVHLRHDLTKIEHDYKDLAAKYEETLPAITDPLPDIEVEVPYSALYPDFYTGYEVTSGVHEDGVIYLTFDDGPSARTPEVLDILKEKDVKATFFIIGSEIGGNEDVLKRMVDEGHTIAMHTDTHNYMDIYESVNTFLADMYSVYNKIYDATGVYPTIFRFPGGSINVYNSGISQELIAEMLRRGFVPFDWNISSQDAATGGPLPASTITYNIVSGAENTSRGVVLMHDSNGKTTTVEALGPTIDELLAMGFELKPLTHDVQSILFTYKN